MAEGCHSAVRLLSVSHRIRNVHIRNVYGTFYVYCVCMTKYYDAPGVRGRFENISLDHIYASFSKGTVDVPGNYGPLIHIGHDVDIQRLDHPQSDTGGDRLSHSHGGNRGNARMRFSLRL